jgi:pyruvate kinase
MQGKTKIVCTLGPATSKVETLVELIRAGMDVARLNFSHGTHDEHREVLRNLRTAAGRARERVAILQDLQGPKIRIGTFAGDGVDLAPGRRFTITTEAVAGDGNRVSTSYEALPTDVRPGDAILLDDGRIRLRAMEIRGSDVMCEVLVGGRLTANKGINLPGVAVSAPSLTRKDLEDLRFGLGEGVDYVALSFVRTAGDVQALRSAIADAGGGAAVIAKIEKPQAIENIDAIIAAADGVMVARGDLGVELPPEDVPLLQKRIIRKCNRAGKPVIVATQMLESMIASPTPTRAEASDVANAVVDGGDAVMLSGETSVGRYPLEAVRIMDRIIRKTESEQAGAWTLPDRPIGDVEGTLDALGRAACVLAEQMKAAAIICVTNSGETARVLSRYRPRPRIVAVTDREATLRRLSLHWGVQGLVIDPDALSADSDRAVEHVRRRLIESGLVSRGEHVVLLGGQPLLERGATNFIKVEKIG